MSVKKEKYRPGGLLVSRFIDGKCYKVINMKLTKLNALQMPTWRWLHMNAAEVETDAKMDLPYRGSPVITGVQKISIQKAISDEIPAGLPRDMERMRLFTLERHHIAFTLTIPKDVRLTEPVVLDFLLDKESPVLLDYLMIHAEPGSKADILIRYRSSGNGDHFHCGFTALRAGAGANVRLFKTQMLGPSDTQIDMTAAFVEENARADVMLCELGGGQVVGGCNISLRGEESRACLDGLYLGSGSRKSDFNYRMEILAPKSEGEILVKGALTGKAKKVLKSTLDFVSGATGSVGRERETVLALSDKALNLSTPLLLCGVENVEGEHATTTGRPDPQKLYYLMSRGFSELDAKRLLVEASFTPVLDKIPLDGLRTDILECVREVVYEEG